MSICFKSEYDVKGLSSIGFFMLLLVLFFAFVLLFVQMNKISNVVILIIINHSYKNYCNNNRLLKEIRKMSRYNINKKFIFHSFCLCDCVHA